MTTPPGNTCPTIDTVISLITAWYKNEENNIEPYIYKMVMRRMEELREANAGLRAWGLELEGLVSDQRETIKELKEKLDECTEDRRKQKEAH
jgi:hypothetical protein